MARPLRVERAGGGFHATARGNERRHIYRGDSGRFHFLELLSEMPERFGVRPHAYVLMDNHFHPLVETPEANLSRSMQWLGVKAREERQAREPSRPVSWNQIVAKLFHQPRSGALFFNRLRCILNFCRRCFGLGLLFISLVTPHSGAAAAKRILVVHSFGNAAPPFTTHSQAFEAELAQKIGEPVDLDEVSLDVARYATLDMEEALVGFLQKRQAAWQPDLVAPIGSPAGVFVAQYRDRLFPETTPILYVGMDQRRLPPAALERNAAFVGESFDLPGFVEDILQVAPATTNIAVVIGASPLELYWTEVLRQEYRRFTNRVNFAWFNHLAFDQMLYQSARMPPHSFILVVLLMRDAAGVAHDADEALQRIHEVANAPINSIFQHQLGLGIVGGRLYQAEREGIEAARIAVRVLHGESISNFPPKIIGPLGPRYDWRELQRWGISQSRLPAGSIIRFREPTFLELYWGWILVVLGVFCVVPIGLHLRQTAQLRAAKERQAAFTQQMILSQEDERRRIAGELHDGLGQILVIMKNQIGLLGRKIGRNMAEAAKSLDELAQTASQALGEVRSISQALRPAALEQIGVTRAIEWMARQSSESSTARFSINVENVDGLLAQGLEINLYRIVQEGLNNILKHAQASHVSLEVSRLEDRLRVSLIDNGTGFDVSRLRDSREGWRSSASLGLVNMTERAKLLGGELEIKSTPGRGTRLDLTIPLGKSTS